MANGYNLTVQLNLQGPTNLNSVINNINRQLGNINANVNLNIPANAVRQVAQVNSSLRQTAASAKAATSAMESFGRASGLAVKRFAAFTTATAGFYAITRATQQSLQKFVEFDKQLTRIAQVTNSTKQSLSGLSSEITRLSVSLGASSSELASIAVTLSQAGLSAVETQKALKALALTTLAPTFNDLNQTVEGSIALMKQFSITTNQLEKALGSINAVAGKFAVEASDLITAVQRAGGVFAAASQGVSTGTDALNEFLAVFTSVRATTRESAETIATGLRTIFTRIQREDTISALQAFGVTLTDLEGKFIGPYKAIEQLAKGLGRLDPRSLEFSGIIEELGGFRQVGKVIPLIQRFTTAQQALNVAQQGSGSLAKDAAIGQQSLAVQISKVKEEFDALIRSIGETSEFKQFIRLSLDLASALIKIADAVKPVLPAIGALAALRIGSGIGRFARGFRTGISGGTKGFNKGGLVPGSGNTDTVRANLTPGEYVIRKQAVQAIGVNNLAKMNKYAKGGKVKNLLGIKPGLADAYDVGAEDLYSHIKVVRNKKNQITNQTREQYRDQAQSILNRASSIYTSTGSTSGANRFIRRKVGLQLPSRLSSKELDPSNQNPQRLNKIQGSLAEKNVYDTHGNLVPIPVSGGADFSVAGSNTSFVEVKNRMDPVSNQDLKAKALLGHQYLSQKKYQNSKQDTTPPLTIAIASTNASDYSSGGKKRKRYNIGGPVQRFGRGGRTMAARDAAFDEKFGSLVTNYENAPLGRGGALLTKATRAFQDYSIREMQHVSSQLQSVGPNITPALMLAGLRSGKIGYGTGIDPKFPKRTPVFFGEQVSRLTTAKKTAGVTSRQTDARTHKNFLKLLGIPEDQIKGISAKQLDKIIGRSFRNTKSGVASKVAAYADVSNFKPGLIAYGKGQGTFGDVVKGFDSKIRSELANDPKLLGHYEGMLKAGTWANYLTSGGKAGHMPALKKKLYSIVGVTERNLGGPIERLSRGGSPEDTVPALLTPGEYVINADAAAAIGERRLNELNNADRIGYNQGGPVQRLFGGGWGGLSPYGMPSRGTNPNSRNKRSPDSGGGMGTFGALIAMQSVVSMLNSTINETSASAMATTKSFQALASGISVGLIAFQMLGGLGKAGKIATGALAGFALVDGLIDAISNSVNEFDKKMGKQTFAQSMDAASKAIDDFAQSANNATARILALKELKTAGAAVDKISSAEQGKQMSLRQKYVDIFLGSTSETGSREQDLARSRVRAQQGLTGIFTELFNPDQFNREVQANMAEVQQNSAQGYAQIRDSLMQIGEIDISRGASIQDVYAGLDADQKERIARANADVAKRIDNATGQDRENIINQEVISQLNASLGPAVAQRAMNVANQAAQQLQVALERVFDSMKQNFAAVASDINSKFGQVADSLSASLGKTQIGYNASAVKNILDNPKAFSEAQIKSVITRAAPLLGNKAGRISDLAMAGSTMEDRITNIMDNVLTDPNVAQGAKLSTIGAELTNLISGLNLGSDVEGVINKQLQEAFKSAREQLGDNADPSEIRQRVQEIVSNLPALNGAIDVVKQAMESLASAQGKYSQSVQQISEAILQQKEYINRSARIGRESQIELMRAMGENIPLERIISDTVATVKDQTGGIFNPEQLLQRQRYLLREREGVSAQRDSISGLADRNADFMQLTQRLGELDIQLAQNRGGLEMLAASTEIASAALNEYSSIQQRAMEKAGFAERMVSAGPQEITRLRQDFAALQNIMDGGELNLGNSSAAQQAMMKAYAEGANYFQIMEAGQGALAGQRGSTLSLLKELKPFFGDNNKAFNQSYEKVLRSYLQSTGMMNPAFEQMFKEMRGQSDQQQRALAVYEEATNIQQRANMALAQMIDPMNALAQSNRLLSDSITLLAQRMNNIPGFATGGPVYASSGKLVNMKPKGTDTVPAMLTPGEFVINAKATKKHRGLLERINGGGSPDMLGGTAYAQDGGFMERAQLKYQTYYRMYKEMYGGMPMPLAMRGQMRMRAMQEAQYEWMMEQQGGQPQQMQVINPANTGRMQILLARKEEEKKKRQQRIQTRIAERERRERERREREREQSVTEARERAATNARVSAELDRQDQSRVETGGMDYGIRNPTPLRRGRPYSSTFNPPLDPDNNQRWDNAIREEELYGPDSERGPKNAPNPYEERAGSYSSLGIFNTLWMGDEEGFGASSGMALDAKYGEEGIFTKQLKEQEEQKAKEYQQGAQEEIARQEREARKLEARQKAERARVERERKWDYLRTTSKELKARASNLLVIEKSRLKNIEENYARAYGGVGGGILGIWDSAFGDSQDKEFFVRQIQEQRAKIQRINYGVGIVDKANRFEPILKPTIDQRLGILKEAEEIFSYTGPAFSVDAREADTERERLREYEAGVGRTGTSAGVSLALAGIGAIAMPYALGAKSLSTAWASYTRAGNGLYRAGTWAARGIGRGRTDIGNWWRTMRSPRGWGGPEWYARASSTGRAAGGAASRGAASRGAAAGQGISSPAGTGYRYMYPNGPVNITSYPLGIPPFGFSSGGIVQPAYLSNGGGAWGFEDLASGYFDYNALNTDYANVGAAYSSIGKYASPREKSYMRIKASGDYGFASQRGFGYDAAGRPVFESRYGYSDPRSDERDFQTLFGYNRYPSFLASGGLAKGSDRYPAMLSRGEMVMNAEATKRNEGLLRALNKSSGGIVNKGILYAKNGTDGPIGGSSSSAQLIMGSSASSPLSDALNGFNISSIILAPQLEAFAVSATSLSDNFGVFKDGATQMEQAAGLLGNASRSFRAPIDTFRQSVQDFASKTSNLISAINNMGEINGTINVRGQIEILPLDVNVIGLEILQPLISNIQNQVLSVVGNALANDNPGININSLSTSSLL